MSPEKYPKLQTVFESIEELLMLIILLLTLGSVYIFSREESNEPGLQELTYMHLMRNISDERMVLCDDNLQGLDAFVRSESAGILKNTSINRRQGDKIPDYIVSNRENKDDFVLVIEVESKEGITKNHTYEQMKDFCEKYDDVCLVTLNESEALDRAMDLRDNLDYEFKIETPTTLSTQL
jgi:hypothetical protein